MRSQCSESISAMIRATVPCARPTLRAMTTTFPSYRIASRTAFRASRFVTLRGVSRISEPMTRPRVTCSIYRRARALTFQTRDLRQTMRR
jgi:hypothetical protein